MTTDPHPLHPMLYNGGDSLPQEQSAGSNSEAATLAKQTSGGRPSGDLQSICEGIEVQIAEEEQQKDITPKVPRILLPSFTKDDCDNEDPENQGDVEWLSLEPTVWDLSLLIGLRHPHGYMIGVWRSILALVLLVTNIFIQFGFVLAVSSSMSADALGGDTWGGVAQNRYGNHHVTTEDPRAGKSKAAMICSEKTFDTTTDLRSQVGTYLQTTRTTQSLGLVGVPGNAVACLAVVIWVLSMTTEIRRVCEVGSAVLSLPLAHSSQPPMDENRDTVHRLGTLHKITICGLILVPRFLTALLLLFFGVSWLGATFNVTDIVLNACALEIVRNVDELLFTALLGRRTQKAIEMVRFKWHSRAKGHERLLIVSRLALVSLCSGVVYKLVVAKRRERVEAFENLLCGGDLDFLWNTDPATLMPVFSRADAVANSSRLALRCANQAAYALVLIRAGFEPEYVGIKAMVTNATIKQMIRGTHEHCMKENPEGVRWCPEVDYAELFDSEKKRGCHDYPTELAVLIEMCKADDHGRNVFEHVRNCDDLCDPTKLSDTLFWVGANLCQKSCKHMCSLRGHDLGPDRRLEKEAQSGEADGASAAPHSAPVDISALRLHDIRVDAHDVIDDSRWRLKWLEGRSRMFEWSSPTLKHQIPRLQHHTDSNEAPRTHADDRQLNDKFELQMEQLRQSIQELQHDKRELRQSIQELQHDKKELEQRIDKLFFLAASVIAALVLAFVAFLGATSLRYDRA